MIIPVRCFTCGKVVGDKWQHYLELLQSDYQELWEYCCSFCAFVRSSVFRVIFVFFPSGRRWMLWSLSAIAAAACSCLTLISLKSCSTTTVRSFQLPIRLKITVPFYQHWSAKTWTTSFALLNYMTCSNAWELCQVEGLLFLYKTFYWDAFASGSARRAAVFIANIYHFPCDHRTRCSFIKICWELRFHASTRGFRVTSHVNSSHFTSLVVSAFLCHNRTLLTLFPASDDFPCRR